MENKSEANIIKIETTLSCEEWIEQVQLAMIRAKELGQTDTIQWADQVALKILVETADKEMTPRELVKLLRAHYEENYIKPEPKRETADMPSHLVEDSRRFLRDAVMKTLSDSTMTDEAMLPFELEVVERNPFEFGFRSALMEKDYDVAKIQGLANGINDPQWHKVFESARHVGKKLAEMIATGNWQFSVGMRLLSYRKSDEAVIDCDEETIFPAVTFYSLNGPVKVKGACHSIAMKTIIADWVEVEDSEIFVLAEEVVASRIGLRNVDVLRAMRDLSGYGGEVRISDCDVEIGDFLMEILKRNSVKRLFFDECRLVSEDADRLKELKEFCDESGVELEISDCVF